MTEPSERSLVTFALFAYNQEKYITEAVEAALAQDYPNLEILISDDASKDGTWNVIQALVDAYKGPHRIVLNRNPQNLGLAAHIHRVIEMASSDIVVVAAGDDISRHDRVSLSAKAFLDSQSVHAVFSNVRKVDGAGNPVGQPASIWSPGAAVTLHALLNGAGGVGIGASYSYRKKCFSWPWPMPSALVSEDKILPLRAHLLGGVAYVPEALVDYRVSGNSLTDHLIRTRQRPGSRIDHLEETERVLVHANTHGMLSDRDLALGKLVLRSLPRMNELDRITSKWPSWLRKLALSTFDNYINRKTLITRATRKLSTKGGLHGS